MELLAEAAWQSILEDAKISGSIIYLDDGAQDLLRWSLPKGVAAFFEAGAYSVGSVGQALGENEHQVGVVVSHVPLIMHQIFENVFLFPACAGFFPVLPSQLSVAPQQQRTLDLEARALPVEDAEDHAHMAAALAAVLDELNLREEVFTLGPSGRLVGRRLLSTHRPLRASAQGVASVVIVPRTEDIVTPLLHTDHLLDRLLNTHTHPLPSATDVCVNVDPIMNLSLPQGSEVHGSIAHPGHKQASDFLSNLMQWGSKEVLLGARKLLADSAARDRLPLNLQKLMSAKASGSQLQNLCALYRSAPPPTFSERAPTLQTATALVHALQAAHWDRATAVEKVLLLGHASGDHSSLFRHLRDLCPNTPLKDVLHFAVIVYALAARAVESLDAQEAGFADALVRTVIHRAANAWEEVCQLPFSAQQLAQLQNMVKEGRSSEAHAYTHTLLAPLLGSLRALALALPDTPSTPSVSGAGGVVARIAEAVLNPGSVPDLPDLEVVAAGLRGKLKTGFGRLLVSKARPADHDTVVVCVLGGVTCAEVRALNDLVTATVSAKRIILVSGRIATHESILRALFPLPVDEGE
eukprot:Colp12_sorted_trinity150504_noHs@16603